MYRTFTCPDSGSASFWRGVEMGEFISQHASEILSFLGGLVGGGAGGSLLTLRFSRQNKAWGGGSIVDQTNASAGGDIVGRDKRVGTDRKR
jgi:hypothetical protein